MNEPRISVTEMERHVARADKLRGGDLAFVDQRMKGYRRIIYNLIGMSVTENEGAPELQPNIPVSAHGFALAYAECDPGEGAALHAHPTEEVFVPMGSRWAIFWREGEKQHEVIIGPGDVINVPIGIYRGFRNVGSERARLLAVIGGPDSGKVTWHPSVLEEARATGLAVDENGVLREIPTGGKP